MKISKSSIPVFRKGEVVNDEKMNQLAQVLAEGVEHTNEEVSRAILKAQEAEQKVDTVYKSVNASVHVGSNPPPHHEASIWIDTGGNEDE